MHDPSRLFLSERVDFRALELGQRLQRAQGQLLIQRQRHPAGEQGVTPEKRHEPGSAGCHNPAIRIVRILYLERA
jgi:hypothetical protein